MKETSTCLQCGATFLRLGPERRDKYCGQACYSASKRERGYTNHNTKLTWGQRDEIVRLYTTPQPDGTWVGAKTIALMFAVTEPSIYNILRKHGVPPRDGKEAHAHGKRCKPTKNLPTSDPPICKCGCQLPTTWNQSRNSWRAYVSGHYRKEQPYKQRQWLYDAYVIHNRTLGDIAQECAVGVGIIHRFARCFNIPIRDRSAAHIGRQAGVKNPAWKGGTTPDRQRLYKAGHWQPFCQKIYERDGFRCRRCGAPKQKEKGLHAHHLKPWADNIALRFDESNVLTLCNVCHKWVHSTANTAKEYLL